MMYRYALAIVLLLGVRAESALSQGFENATTSQGIIVINSGFSILGNGVSFYDFNQDGLDDLTYLLPNDSVIFYINTGSGFVRDEVIPNSTDAKHPLWADFDNDGDPDLLVTKRAGGTRLYRNDGEMVFTDVTGNLNIPSTNAIHIYGAAWGDYDRDGWLDLFLSTYSSSLSVSNYLCHNNGDGTFTEVSATAGLMPESGFTFQGVWQDFNDDNWPDLFIVNEANIPNQLYYNNGDGTFTDVSDETGAGVQLQSMSNSICDYDQDGDWDIYITNGLQGNYLLRNDDGMFINVASESGVIVNSFCWSAIWMDHDHNGLEDLHVCTATNILNQDWFFTNDGDGTFSDAMYPVFSEDFTFTYCTARGDFNNDGFWDMAITRTGMDPYSLLNSVPNGNHWLKLDLAGTWSNKDAIGTLIEYYHNDKQGRIYTKAGENYMGQNSQYQILSLGASEAVDSLVITWPRGLVERWYNVSADQVLELIEGSATSASIQTPEGPVICGENSVTLDAGIWASYLWSTGDETPSIEVSQPGVYEVALTDSSGYPLTASIEVLAFPVPEINTTAVTPSCAGGSDGYVAVAAVADNLDFVNWVGYTTVNDTLFSLAAGTFEFTAVDENGCSAEGSVVLGDGPSILIESVNTNDVSCYGDEDGNAEVVASGGTGVLEVNWNALNPQALPAGQYTVEVTDEAGCTAEAVFFILQPDSLIIEGVTEDVSCAGLADGQAFATASGGNGIYIFEWNGADPENLQAGDYTLTVFDAIGCEATWDFTISQPSPLELTIVYTDANDGDNGSAEVNVIGGTEPYTFLWSNGDEDELAEGLGQGSYTITATDANGCEIQGEVYITDVNVGEYAAQNIQVYPNPVLSGSPCTIRAGKLIQELRMVCPDGRNIVTALPNAYAYQLMTQHLASGIYIVHLVMGDGEMKSIHLIVR